MISNKNYMFLSILVFIFLSFSLGAEPFVIAVAGGSASGKTYIARKLVEKLGHDKAILYSMDNYYAPEQQPKEFYSNGSINYDHPTVVDLRKLANDLQLLKFGQAITVKEYTYGRAVEKDTFIATEPRTFIILEGLYVLYPELDHLVDLKVFVDVDVDTRLRRRLKRDEEEGRSKLAGDIKKYFLTIVEPMHQQHIQSTARHAHLVVDSPDEQKQMEENLQRLASQVEQYFYFKRCERRLAATH